MLKGSQLFFPKTDDSRAYRVTEKRQKLCSSSKEVIVKDFGGTGECCYRLLRTIFELLISMALELAY